LVAVVVAVLKSPFQVVVVLTHLEAPEQMSEALVVVLVVRTHLLAEGQLDQMSEVLVVVLKHLLLARQLDLLVASLRYPLPGSEAHSC
jgi:hypothetical protein